MGALSPYAQPFASPADVTRCSLLLLTFTIRCPGSGGGTHEFEFDLPPVVWPLAKQWPSQTTINASPEKNL